jgi:hypothetical protein
MDQFKEAYAEFDHIGRLKRDRLQESLDRYDMITSPDYEFVVAITTGNSNHALQQFSQNELTERVSLHGMIKWCRR